MHHSQAQTRIDAPAVDQHGAGAALAVVTTPLRALEPAVFAQRIKGRRAAIDVERIAFPVDLQLHPHEHRRRIIGCRHGASRHACCRTVVTAVDRLTGCFDRGFLHGLQKTGLEKVNMHCEDV